jgi:nickel/cobalt exporter
MRSAVRRLVAGLMAISAAAALTGTASAHPLGNYTVNRAVVVRIDDARIEVRYVVDMAEIPTFSELQQIDANRDGETDLAEQAAYAGHACEADRAALRLTVSGQPLALVMITTPQLSFPAGAGGLRTLRLVCGFEAQASTTEAIRDLAVQDRTDDGHVGWREVTISADAGVAIVSSTVPSVSRSAELTRYPVDSLQSPPDVHSGTAMFRAVGGSSGARADQAPAAPRSRVTADDPLASLIAGQGGAPVALLAILLATGLGALHAVSPGHGKTLVAAYLIGSQGSTRHAAVLGLTVAATHTAGVFVLGVATLAASQILVPERVIGWLSIGSGILVVLLGAGLVVRAARAASARRHHAHEGEGHSHGDERPHRHEHSDGNDHPTGHGHQHRLRPRNVVALGLAGGMVPSGSALIVLLVAVTTGRLLFGAVLIAAFGIGMALVLGGLAMATTVARTALTRPSRLSSSPVARRLAALIPLVSGLAVLGAGLAVTVEAIARFA